MSDDYDRRRETEDSDDALSAAKARIEELEAENVDLKTTLVTHMTDEQIETLFGGRDALEEAERHFDFVMKSAIEKHKLEAQNKELREALKYARRFLNKNDHDTDFVDAALSNEGPK